MAQLAPGTIVDSRYLVVGAIARGGMSTIYHGVDTRLDRPVALKVLDERFAHDESFRSRFQREARAVARLHHPTLVNVYDQDVDGDIVFLVMELVEGGTLRELLRERGPMPPHAAVAVMDPVCQALGIAHEAGLIHRDVKPENVLIGAGHQVKLADFGLVRAVADATLTSASVIMGTVAYLSPEQVRGSAVDARSDVYSAGILLYELLTGSTPFSADTQLAVAYQRLDNPVPAPSEAIAGVPPQFDELVARACAIDPADRYDSAISFRADMMAVARQLALPPFTVPVPSRSAFIEHEQNLSAQGIDVESMTQVALAQLHHPDTSELDDNSSPSEGRRDNETLLFPGAAQASQSPPMRQPQPPPSQTAPPQPGPPQSLQQTQPQPASQHYQRVGQQYPSQPVSPHYVPSDYPQAAPEPDNPPPPAPKNRLTWFLLLLVGLLLIGGISVGAWWLGSGQYGQVPQVVGMESQPAQNAITQAGFDVAIDEVYSDAVPSEHVAAVSPPEETREKRGSRVTLEISRGQPRVPLIPASGELDDYTPLLAERSLSVGTTSQEYSDSVAEGKIIRVFPTPDTPVNTESQVRVVTSKGPKPIRIPSVSSMTEEDARDALESAGLTHIDVRVDSSADASDGPVVRTEPAAGQQVDSSTPITIVLSKKVQVPTILTLTVEDAREKLAGRGLKLTGVGEDDERIITQRPLPGGDIARGGSVEAKSI